MQSIPQLVNDLALLLAVAAVATIVCRRFKQPLVLGYVVAGFLVSPAIGWIPNIVETADVSTWSQIGVIFLMFGLGLQFSVVKLTTVGRPALVTAVVEMSLMIAAGFACGTLLGWSPSTSLFLGGMLAISSSSIIVKTFGELGLRTKAFAQLVFGVLVIEDIAGVFLLVVLSTVAVSASVDGGAVAVRIGRMALYLVVWFALSVILVPSALKRLRSELNDEILLIASIALCLGDGGSGRRHRVLFGAGRVPRRIHPGRHRAGKARRRAVQAHQGSVRSRVLRIGGHAGHTRGRDGEPGSHRRHRLGGHHRTLAVLRVGRSVVGGNAENLGDERAQPGADRRVLVHHRRARIGDGRDSRLPLPRHRHRVGGDDARLASSG